VAYGIELALQSRGKLDATALKAGIVMEPPIPWEVDNDMLPYVNPGHDQSHDVLAGRRIVRAC
jgi:hypothetical protein